MSSLIQYQLVDSQFKPYEPNYPQVFQTVRYIIFKVIPGIEIEHIGSTAIPGMSGKPIIDILIPCLKSEFTYVLDKLKEVGFQAPPFSNIPKERPMKVAGIRFKDEFYNIHVHLTPRNSEVYLNNIYFREQLIQNPQLTKKYEQIKQSAINSGKVEATEYNLAKSPFIQSILQGRTNS